MAEFTPCANSVSKNIGYKLNGYNPSCEKPCMKHKKIISSNKVETCDSTEGEALKENNLIFQEHGDAIIGYVHVQKPPVQLSGLHEIPFQEETKEVEEAKMCQEFCQSVSLDAKLPKILTKSATFSCSQEVQFCFSSVNGRCELPRMEGKDQNSWKSERPAYVRSLSLPGSVKLVSAMKGGRERHGETPKMDLHVKWAVEVHDPPATSLSHTVRSHHQRPKSKKKEKARRKQKQNKGKSSRGSGSESKQTNQQSTDMTTDARLQTTSERLLLDTCGCSNVEAMDYAVNGQEFNCGSSLMESSLDKLHVSFAEAS